MDSVLVLAGLLEVDVLEAGITFGLMVKLVTPKVGVLTDGVAEAALRFAPLEKAGVLAG